MYKKEIKTNITFCSIDELSKQEKELIKAAKRASLEAYAPYSGFKVGSALLLDNGEILAANNQENAAYPSGLCAERVVLFYANAAHSQHRVLSLAVAASKEGMFTENPISPCGSCRQALLESERRQNTAIRLLLSGEKEVAVVESVASLLPLSFNL
ncbi:MAG TPA: cytidine deaminase [Bacteroidales bacterium]|nr:cytidine deaminase [Bacteroidales bacterium]